MIDALVVVDTIFRLMGGGETRPLLASMCLFMFVKLVVSYGAYKAANMVGRRARQNKPGVDDSGTQCCLLLGRLRPKPRFLSGEKLLQRPPTTADIGLDGVSLLSY
jgi:hypothetical protein